jgi:hypothetical protein
MAALATGRMRKRGREVKAGPVSGVLWGRSRQRKASRKAGGGKLRNGWQQTLTFAGGDFSFDLDMGRIVAYVSIGLARFFRDQLERGETPLGRPIPDVDEDTRDRYARARPHVGYRTGYMADHWYLGPIRGSQFSATRLLKPYGGTGGAPLRAGPGSKELGRDLLINLLLERGIDFQSVKGKAAIEMYRLFQEAIAASFGEVTLPERFSRDEGLLPSFRGEGGGRGAR